MPWRMAPAWPVGPPPDTVTSTSKRPSDSVSSSGWRTSMREVSRPKYSSGVLPLMVIAPLPGLMNTRAAAGLRLLRRVRMLRAGVDLELAELGVAERALGQHALHGLLDDALRMIGEHVAELGHPEAARILGVAVVDLALELVAGRTHLGCVDHDDVVAGVAVGRVVGLVLAAQAAGDLGGEAAQDLVRSVNHDPVALDGLAMSEDGLHASHPSVVIVQWPMQP